MRFLIDSGIWVGLCAVSLLVAASRGMGVPADPDLIAVTALGTLAVYGFDRWIVRRRGRPWWVLFAIAAVVDGESADETAEVWNTVDDDDGCPDLDNDHDGLADVQDRCPKQPEDHERYGQQQQEPAVERGVGRCQDVVFTGWRRRSVTRQHVHEIVASQQAQVVKQD